MNRAKRSAGILSTAAIAAAVALTAFAVPAGAVKSTKPVRAIGTAELSGKGATGTAVARCPKGTSVLGGGYGQTPPATIPGATLVDIGGSYRLNKRSWAVTGVQVLTGRSLLTAYAYCLKKIKIKTGAKSVPLPAAARSQATVVATCPSGTAVSGGFRKPNYDGTFTFLTDFEQDAKNSWTMTGVRSNTAATVAGSLTSYAYCAKGKIREVISNGTGILATAPAARSILPSPICKPRPYAGGFRAPYIEVNSSADGRGSFLVTDSRQTGKTWTVAGLPIGGSNTVGTAIAFSALAYCG
jgi:hypothetical protein